MTSTWSQPGRINSRSVRWPATSRSIRSAKSSSQPKISARVIIPITCSKKSLSNQTQSATRCGRLNPEECTAKLGGLNMAPPQLRDVGRIVLTGCGTALHAARVGEYLIERLANIPTEVDYSSEFRHRNTPMTPETLVFAISQSGETADKLGALRESRRKGFRTLGICNNVASTIARESDGGVYMHAGPEIGVAATKSFTSQLVILA